LRLSRGLPLVFLELEELHLELVEQHATTRQLAEPLVPQPGDRVPQVLDLQTASPDLVLDRRGALRTISASSASMWSGRGSSVARVTPPLRRRPRLRS